MDIFAILGSLQKAIGSLAGILKHDQAVRDEIIDIISELASALIRGMDLVNMRLLGAINLDSPNQLVDYIYTTRNTLNNTFSEFLVCKGMAKLEDRFNRAISTVKLSVNINSISAVSGLIIALGDHEGMIFSLIDKELNDIVAIPQLLGPEEMVKELNARINAAIAEIEIKKSEVKRIAKEILDKL